MYVYEDDNTERGRCYYSFNKAYIYWWGVRGLCSTGTCCATAIADADDDRMACLAVDHDGCSVAFGRRDGAAVAQMRA